MWEKVQRIQVIMYKKWINPCEMIVQINLMLWLVVKTAMAMPSSHLTFF